MGSAISWEIVCVRGMHYMSEACMAAASSISRISSYRRAVTTDTHKMHTKRIGALSCMVADGNIPRHNQISTPLHCTSPYAALR